ncbi:MAG: tetratricopeptide repeat protein [Planctomycetaceae bacterium]|nr:tetratricopeptide repeat protein [Planctomycetaceae bacterium]
MRTLSLPATLETSEQQSHHLRRWGMRLGFWIVTFLWIGLASTLCGCNMMHGPTANMVGQSHFRRGHFAAAQGAFQRAMADDPFNANYAYNMARAMEKQGNTQGAEQMYQKAMTIDPAHQLAYRSLGKMLVAQGRQNEATLMMQAWADTQPYSAAAYTELATIQRQNGDIAGAQQSLQQAQRLQPQTMASAARFQQQQQAMRPVQQTAGTMPMENMMAANGPALPNSPYMNTGFQTYDSNMTAMAGSYPTTSADPYMASAASPGMTMQPTPGAMTYSTTSPSMMPSYPGSAMPYQGPPMPTFAAADANASTAGSIGASMPFPSAAGTYGTPMPVAAGSSMPLTTVTPGTSPTPATGYAPTVAPGPPVAVGAVPSVSAF